MHASAFANIIIHIISANNKVYCHKTLLLLLLPASCEVIVAGNSNVLWPSHHYPKF